MKKEALLELYATGGAELVKDRLSCSLPTAYRLLKLAGAKLDGRKKNSDRRKKFKLEI